MTIMLAAAVALSSPSITTETPPLCIMPAATGAGTGAGWANAGSLANLNDFIAAARVSGAEIWLRADAGTYPDGARTLNQGGTAGDRVVIRGVNEDGTDAYATIVGNRTTPYVPPATPLPWYRTAVMSLATGANHLEFRFIKIRNSNNGLLRTINAAFDIVVEDCEIENARHGINSQSADLVDFVIRRFNAHGYSKRAILIAKNSRNGLIEDCTLDSEQQDKDSFSGGVIFDDTAHDITVRNVTAINHYESKGASNYWNADSFSSERGNYNLHFEDCYGAFCTDGGWDLKSYATTLLRCTAEGNKRNYRLWGEITLTQCVGITPFKRGGSGDSYQVGAYGGSFIRIINSTFTNASWPYTFSVESTGFLATDQLTRNQTTQGGSNPHWRVTGADAQYALLDLTDTTPPTLTSAPAYSVPESARQVLPLTANKPFVVELQPGSDAAMFSGAARRLSMKKQDYEAPVHPDNQLHAFVRLRDANNNRTAPIEIVVSILDVDDAPIDAAEAFAYPGSNGFWYEIRPETCWQDVEGTIPAAPGNPVLRFDDLSGNGNHATQPDETRAAILASDGADLYWLEVDGFRVFYEIGSAGEFRFSQKTAVFIVRRTDEGDGTASNENRQYLYSYPRSGSSAVFNSVFSLGVIGGNDTWARSGSNNATGSDGSGTASRAIALSLRSTDGQLRSDSAIVGDVADVATLTYASSVASKKARLFCDGEPTATGFFDGRFYGGALLNQAANDGILLRLEKQLIQLAGRIL